jgi:hypothetical protein
MFIFQQLIEQYKTANYGIFMQLKICGVNKTDYAIVIEQPSYASK